MNRVPIKIFRVNEETIEVYHRKVKILRATYAEMGWSGMEAVEQAVMKTALIAGLTVEFNEGPYTEDT